MNRDADDVMTDEEFADTRASLGLAVPPVTPSAAMKDAVMARIAETPQDAPQPAAVAAAIEARPDAVGPVERRAQARWFHRPGSVVLAAAAAVALFFGGVLSADLVNPAAGDAQQLAAIVAAPDVQTVSSPIEGGASATLVSSETLGVSAMVFEGLPQLTEEQAYALWYITDGEPTPAGLFSVGDDGTVVQVLEGSFEAGTVVGVTVEPSSGSPAPTTTPIVAIATA
ncbi:MAG: anti-sigma factor [Microcella sp.]|uniref:anti-sigma factor n=1 Tax=Microcella sp. TaxID=1913979 RepID=UPI003315F26D